MLSSWLSSLVVDACFQTTCDGAGEVLVRLRLRRCWRKSRRKHHSLLDPHFGSHRQTCVWAHAGEMKVSLRPCPQAVVVEVPAGPAETSPRSHPQTGVEAHQEAMQADFRWWDRPLCECSRGLIEVDNCI